MNEKVIFGARPGHRQPRYGHGSLRAHTAEIKDPLVFEKVMRVKARRSSLRRCAAKSDQQSNLFETAAANRGLLAEKMVAWMSNNGVRTGMLTTKKLWMDQHGFHDDDAVLFGK